jgi:hypothetical protein
LMNIHFSFSSNRYRRNNDLCVIGLLHLLTKATAIAFALSVFFLDLITDINLRLKTTDHLPIGKIVSIGYFFLFC